MEKQEIKANKDTGAKATDKHNIASEHCENKHIPHTSVIFESINDLILTFELFEVEKSHWEKLQEIKIKLAIKEWNYQTDNG